MSLGDKMLFTIACGLGLSSIIMLGIMVYGSIQDWFMRRELRKLTEEINERRLRGGN